MSDFVGIDVQGIPQLQKFLANLVPEVQDAVVDDVSEYIINVLRAYPPQQHIPRAVAFPDLKARTPTGKFIQGFKSWAQFKKVMAMWSKGEIPYRRTQELSRGWKQIGRGRNSIIANESPHAAWTVSDSQTRQMEMGGWKKIGDTLDERAARIAEKAEAGAKRAIRKLGG